MKGNLLGRSNSGREIRLETRRSPTQSWSVTRDATQPWRTSEHIYVGPPGPRDRRRWEDAEAASRETPKSTGHATSATFLASSAHTPLQASNHGEVHDRRDQVTFLDGSFASTPREATESGKSAMQVLAAFRWSGAVPWPDSSVYRIFSEIEMDAAPDWRGFPGKSSSWALSRHHPAFLSLSPRSLAFSPSTGP